MSYREKQRKADMIIATASGRETAVDELRSKFYGASTAKSMKARLNTFERMMIRAGEDPYPIEMKKIELMAAALRKADESGDDTWVEFTAVEKSNLRRIKRACVRGISPDEGAEPLTLETLRKQTVYMRKGKIREEARSAAYTIAWWFMMRGGELVELRIGQVAVNGAVATVKFEVTKNDQKGQGCQRSQQCACKEEIEGYCPVHAMMQLLEYRAGQGAEKNDLLFVNNDGQRWDQGSLRETLKADLRNSGIQEAEQYSLHSFRVGGTQGHIEAGVSTESTKAFGRWRSNVIDRYARESYMADSESYTQRINSRREINKEDRKENTKAVRASGEVDDRDGWLLHPRSYSAWASEVAQELGQAQRGKMSKGEDAIENFEIKLKPLAIVCCNEHWLLSYPVMGTTNEMSLLKAGFSFKIISERNTAWLSSARKNFQTKAY
ncbi:hypothetical protein FOL47_001363 [Perkinsus chesapeaki]|uniref:Tyr recombinase domain-containing protein n=1 Tax=Perkinsus chesapeaki TaxID=330153 RepID=A0A7J6KSE9_PERCH|nr:hypothetical protein FOL47_001363 [Perkinsus chesapeaki]